MEEAGMEKWVLDLPSVEDSRGEKPFRCHVWFCRLEGFVWETCEEGHVGVLCGAIKKGKTQASLLQPGDLLLK